MSGQLERIKDEKNGPEMAQRLAQRAEMADGRRAKTHPDYWKVRLVRRTYENAHGQTVEIPEWHVRVAFRGRREWFNLDTANQAAAATKARDLFLSLLSTGWEATLGRYKPGVFVKAEVCTVGEFLADVTARSHLKPATVRRYAVKLRKTVADVAKVDAEAKGKAKRAKYDYVNGGRAAWLAKIDGQRLDLLAPETVNE